jgi:heat shock protein HslJ
MRSANIVLILAALTAATAVKAEPTPRLEGSAWLITSLGGKLTRNAPRVEFVRGQVIGSSGCNGFEGSYTRRREMLIFRRVSATEMACGGMVDVQERALFALLGPSVQMRYGPGGTLRLSSGKRVAVLRRSANCVSCNRPPPPLPAPSLAGKSWAILSLNGRAVSRADKARITFTSDRLSATLGCNQMGGAYRIEKSSSLVARQMMSTLIGCPAPLDQEEQLLSALLSDTPVIERVSKSGEGMRIRLSSGQNEALLEYVR